VMGGEVAVMSLTKSVVPPALASVLLFSSTLKVYAIVAARNV